MNISCKFHGKTPRCRIKFFESEMLVVVECAECPKGTELVRFKVKETVP
jgi:hypothetical protein